MNRSVLVMLACCAANVAVALIPGSPYVTALDWAVAGWCLYVAWSWRTRTTLK